MKQPCQKLAGLFVLWLAQGCGRCTERRGCRIKVWVGIDKIRNNAGLKTHEQNEEHRHPMPGNRRKKAAEYRGEQDKETRGAKDPRTKRRKPAFNAGE